MTTVLKISDPNDGRIVRLENATWDGNGWTGIDPEDGESRFFPHGIWEEVED